MMFNKLMTATALLLVSGGLAFAQASGTGSTNTEGAGGTSFKWDQTSQDSFFSDGALRAETDVRAAFDALDTTQKDQLRAACGSDAAGAAGSATSTGTAGTASGSASDSGNTTGGATGTAASGSSGSTVGSGSAASMPDASSMQQLCAQIQTY